MEEQEKRLVDAFTMMWGNYPEPVRLIHRSFRVVAGNTAYLNTGGELGGRCCDIKPAAIHKGCQAMNCLNEQKPFCKSSRVLGVKWDTYWIPVDGCADYYVHFTNGMNKVLDKTKTLRKTQS